MRIAIFNCWIDYQTIPILSSLITSYIHRKIYIDLFTIGNPEQQGNPYFSIVKFSKVLFNTISPFVILFRSLGYLRRQKYKYLLAVDAHMILASLLVAKLFNIKVVYMSLEIFVKQDINSMYYRLYYWQQRYLLYFFDAVIIMDEKRKELLLSNSNIDTRKSGFILLPNAPLGTARKMRSTFLHERLRIEPDHNLLLCPGQIAHTTCSPRLREVSNGLSRDQIVVIHTPMKKKIKSVPNEYSEDLKFRLSLEPVSSSNLENLYSSAHIGLVIYSITKTGVAAENVRCIGKSSGKLAYFLKVGVPVILSDQPYFRYIADKYGCGECISDFSQIATVVETIERKYDVYVKGCIECFKEELDYDKHFEDQFFALS